MADNVIKVSVTSTKSQRVSVSSSQQATNITASPDTGRFWSQTSKNWAVSENIVDGEDYSSKYYANKSKQFAQNAESYLQSTRESYNSFVADANTYINEMAELKETGAEEINEAVASGKDEISSAKTTILNDIEFVADGEKKEIEDLADLIKENAEEIANRTSFAMFDTVLKDHVLTYEESKGLALQGTWVYKEAVAGSRYGYPDFYNKCLEEYQNSTENIYFTEAQPTLTQNGTVGGSSYACRASSNENSSFPTYYAFDGNIETRWSPSSRVVPQYLDYYTPTPIFPSSIYLDFYNENEAYSAGTIQGSNDGESWDNLGSFSGNASQKITIELVATKTYKYIRFYATGLPTGATGTYGKVAEIKIYARTESEIKKHPNGHVFYDISEKDKIDELFSSTGMAWMYGIDQENERVFLPRNNYFEQATGEVSEVGQSVEAGLPNITGGTGYGGSETGTMTGAFYSGGKSTVWGPNSYGSQNHTAYFDASLSNDIYGNSDTVQPPAVKKLLYICVGNTVSQSTITDVVDVTTTENDTTPLFTGLYFDFKPNNASWLKGGEQANNAGIYKTCYNELVNVLNGETKYGDLKVIDTTNMISGVDYSEYWKVNQTNMTFTTPTAISNKALSGAVVGNGMTLGLNNGSIECGLVVATPYSGSIALSAITNAYGQQVGVRSEGGYPANSNIGVTTDPTKSGIIAEQATSQLYFKVANAVQNLELLDVGRVMEETVLRSHLVEAQCVTETYTNGKSGYRLWSDGYHEEWGAYTTSEAMQTPTITFLKPFTTTNYIIYGADNCYQTAGDKSCKWGVTNLTISSFGLQAQFVGHAGTTIYWKASGY